MIKVTKRDTELAARIAMALEAHNPTGAVVGEDEREIIARVLAVHLPIMQKDLSHACAVALEAMDHLQHVEGIKAVCDALRKAIRGAQP